MSNHISFFKQEKWGPKLYSVELGEQIPENVSKQPNVGPFTTKFDFFSAMSDPAKNRR